MWRRRLEDVSLAVTHWLWAPRPEPRLATRHFGVHFPHPVGLALHTDTLLEHWSAHGFAFAELDGSVARHLQGRRRVMPTGIVTHPSTDASTLPGDWLVVGADGYATHDYARPEHGADRPVVARICADLRNRDIDQQVDRALAAELSGVMLTEASAERAPDLIGRVYRRITADAGGRGHGIPILSAGVTSAQDAEARILAGASLLLLSATAYLENGPRVLKTIVSRLSNSVVRHRALNLRGLVGYGA